MARGGKLHAVIRGDVSIRNVHFQGGFTDIISGGSPIFFDRLFDGLQQNPGMPQSLGSVGWGGGFLIFFIVSFQKLVDNRCYFLFELAVILILYRQWIEVINILHDLRAELLFQVGKVRISGTVADQGLGL